MNAQELAVRAMALGAIAAVALARLADLVARPSISQFQGVAYHLAVFLLVLILSGVWRQFVPGTDPGTMQVAQALAGPVCVGLSDLWIRSWLNAAATRSHHVGHLARLRCPAAIGGPVLPGTLAGAAVACRGRRFPVRRGPDALALGPGLAPGRSPRGGHDGGLPVDAAGDRRPVRDRHGTPGPGPVVAPRGRRLRCPLQRFHRLCPMATRPP